MFVKPEKFDFHVTSQNAKEWSEKILIDLLSLLIQEKAQILHG